MTDDPPVTRVTGTARRPVGYTTFADLTDAPLLRVRPGERGQTVLTFGGELDEDTVDAIWQRLVSTDDTDQAERAAIRAGVAAIRAVGTNTTTSRLVVLLAQRVIEEREEEEA